MTSPQELKEMSFAELQERADIGEMSFAEIGKICWNELCNYVRLLDEFYALKGSGARWSDHHDVIDTLHNKAWHAHDIRSFQRFLETHKQYHFGWRFDVLQPLEQRLKKMLESEDDPERIQLLQEANLLLKQGNDSYMRLLEVTDIGEGMVDDFFDESRYGLIQRAELERANAALEAALQLERQRQHAEIVELRAENSFGLPVGAQDFSLKQIEAAARQNGFRSTRRQLQQHLANWKKGDRERGERWLLSRAELEEFLRYLIQRQRDKP